MLCSCCSEILRIIARIAAMQHILFAIDPQLFAHLTVLQARNEQARTDLEWPLFVTLLSNISHWPSSASTMCAPASVNPAAGHC
jgi:hypothetical protein